MLVLILQFAEGLSDRQAAEAVRTRIDWKYMLCLEITDPGFDYSVLSEFRARLIEQAWEQQLFDRLLQHVKAHGLLQGQREQRTDSTHVLGATRDLSRLELVGETMRRVLNSLAIVAPDWTLAHSLADWVERYGARLQDYRLPKGQAQRETYAEVIGADGLALLQALWEPATPRWMREIPAVRTLHRVWLQSYTWRDESTLRWRQPDELPPAMLAVRTPYDDEVRFGRKRATDWMGYKVHLTETCDPDAPRIITHVETSPAPMADERVTTRAREAQALKRHLQVPKLAELHAAFNLDSLPAAIRFLHLSVEQRERHLPRQFPRCRICEPRSKVRGQRIKIQVETVTRADRHAAGGQDLPHRMHQGMRQILRPRPQPPSGDQLRLGVKGHPHPQIVRFVAQRRVKLIELEMAQVQILEEMLMHPLGM